MPLQEGPTAIIIWMFQWYDYLQTLYENLVVGIDYIAQRKSGIYEAINDDI